MTTTAKFGCVCHLHDYAGLCDGSCHDDPDARRDVTMWLNGFGTPVIASLREEVRRARSRDGFALIAPDVIDRLLDILEQRVQGEKGEHA